MSQGTPEVKWAHELEPDDYVAVHIANKCEMTLFAPSDASLHQAYASKDKVALVSLAESIAHAQEWDGDDQLLILRVDSMYYVSSRISLKKMEGNKP